MEQESAEKTFACSFRQGSALCHHSKYMIILVGKRCVSELSSGTSEQRQHEIGGLSRLCTTYSSNAKLTFTPHLSNAADANVLVGAADLAAHDHQSKIALDLVRPSRGAQLLLIVTACRLLLTGCRWRCLRRQNSIDHPNFHRSFSRMH
jgi:hypothetical protein